MHIEAVSSGRWKLQLPHNYSSIVGRTPGRDGKPGGYNGAKLTEPELYDLESDISESKDVAAEHPEIVAKLQTLAEQSREELGDSLTQRKGQGAREPGRIP